MRSTLWRSPYPQEEFYVLKQSRWRWPESVIQFQAVELSNLVLPYSYFCNRAFPLPRGRLYQ